MNGKYINCNGDCSDEKNFYPITAFEESGVVGHFSASVWTVNKERTKTLMVYHNIYNSWSWIGGHADGEEDLCAVAMRELTEETGLRNGKLLL